MNCYSSVFIIIYRKETDATLYKVKQGSIFFFFFLNQSWKDITLEEQLLEINVNIIYWDKKKNKTNKLLNSNSADVGATLKNEANLVINAFKENNSTLPFRVCCCCCQWHLERFYSFL